MQIIRYMGILGIVLGLCVGVFIEYGHQYRAPFNEQFESYFDGLEWQRTTDGNPDSRDKKLDKFNPSYYEEVRSVSEAVDFIQDRFELGSEADTAIAVQQFVSERFIHHAPRHSFLTNPFYWLLEKRNPQYAPDKLYTADELLRHSAAAECANAANAFVEIYRGFGLQAQFIDLVGHQLAEAIVDGEKWLVDPDLEVIAPHSIEEVQKRLELIDYVYNNRSLEYRENLKRVFSNAKSFQGYDGTPSNDEYLYELHETVDKYKRWVGPIMFLISLCLYLFGSMRRVRH